MRVLQHCFHSLKAIIADGGYCGAIINEVKERFGTYYRLQIIMDKQKQDKAFQPVHKRWIVEITFSWFDQDRRLCRNYELLI